MKTGITAFVFGIMLVVILALYNKKSRLPPAPLYTIYRTDSVDDEDDEDDDDLLERYDNRIFS